jgi:protein-tyrosine phosphatase
MADYPSGLISYYRDVFGTENVLHAPIDDYHLASRYAVEEKIIPFLRDSDEKSLPVVVHCWSGNGRTGHILAAWLVRARDMDVAQAVTVVEQLGRKPREAVREKNATESELYSVLGGSA